MLARLPRPLSSNTLNAQLNLNADAGTGALASQAPRMAPDKLPLRDLKDYQLEDFLSMPSFPRIVTTSEVQGSRYVMFQC